MGQHNPSLPTDQLDKYKTSVHGKLLFGKGDKNVANCISCHSVHDIADANTPYSTVHATNIPKTCGRCHADEAYMAKYNIPTDQLADYQQSVHGVALLERGDLGAPACNDCHGNHGATPPGFSSISTVCGHCHALQGGLFDHSPHKIAFEENDFPMCETCHSNHKILRPSDEMLGVDEGAVCPECHSKDDGNRGYETAVGVAESVNKLLVAHLGAKTLLDEAIAKGMMTTDEEFRLKEVETALQQTRSMVHAFNIDSVRSRSEAGVAMADSVTANAASLIDEYYFRRRGLVVATVIMAILAIALYVKIRRMSS
jgi:predicted CXXCH cytochrome family protein